MAKLHTEVLIRELPPLDIIMPNTIDWVSIGSIALTALVVVGTTIFTLYNLKKTINLQEKFAEDRNRLEQEKSHREMISKNRQEWINSLRHNVSQFVGVIQSLDNHAKKINIKLDCCKELVGNEKVMSEFNVYDILDQHASEAWALITRIKLHLNPTEDLSGMLVQSLKDIFHIAMAKDFHSDGHIVYWDKLDLIEMLTQKILKTEWERVKAI
jgi:hypothetical protein